MELYQEILAKVLENREIQIVFPGLTINAAEIIEGECYKTLQKIKALIEDDRLSDPECFMQIEEIVVALEQLGSDGGCRHDFG